MKEIPGSQTIRSSTGRGTAEIDVYFTWSVDMRRSELDVRSRLAQVHDVLPATASADVYRMTFSVFPIAGFSLTSDRAARGGCDGDLGVGSIHDQTKIVAYCGGGTRRGRRRSRRRNITSLSIR